MENEARDEPASAGPEDDELAAAMAALARLEEALDRIGRTAHPVPSAAQADPQLTAHIAHRLDALIVQVRNALADRAAPE